nr:hypothetical protein [Tanacetum cinerariifolium]
VATPTSPVIAPTNKELADQQAAIIEAERQELLEQELKQNIDAEQVYLDSLVAQRVAEEQDRESMASAAHSTHRQAELDRVALNLSNEEWIGLVDQVWANQTLSAELLGADVSKDTFSVRMIEYDKIHRAVDLATAKDQHQHLKRSELQETTSVSAGATIAAGDPIPAVTSVSASFSVSATFSILLATPIATGVSTTVGASRFASEASVPIIELLDSPSKDTSLPLGLETEEQDVYLRKYSRKKSIAKKRTLPSPSKPKSDAFPFDKDDPKAAFKRYLRQASNDDEPAEPVSLSLVSDITIWEIIPTEFGRGNIHIITRADCTVKRFSTLMELIYMAGRADLMVLYGLVLDKYKTKRATAGDIMYMFMDMKYPHTPTTLQQMLNHGLEIDRDTSDYLPFSTLLVHQRFYKAKQRGLKDDHDNKQVTIQFRGGLLGIIIPAARVFCFCWQVFIPAGDLFLLADDTSAIVVHDTSSSANAETSADTKKSNSVADTEILNDVEEQGEEVSNMMALEEKTLELDEGQAGSDPCKTLKSRPPPKHELTKEDQAGSNHGQSHVAQAGPNPKPMNEDFIATVEPKVHEIMKLTSEEHVHIENPPNSSETLSSIKNLEDTFTFGDQFLNDKPTEEEPGKASVETKVESLVIVPIHLASLLVPLLSTPVIDLSPLKPPSPPIQEPIFTATTAATTTLLLPRPPPPLQSIKDSNLFSRLCIGKENHDLYSKINKQVNKVIKEAVHDALQAPIMYCFWDLSKVQMKEILHDRMFENGSYKSHPDHSGLYEALEVSIQRDNDDELHEALVTSHKRCHDDQDHPPPPSKDSDRSKKKI